MKQTAVEYLWEKLFEIKNTVPFDEQIGAIMKAYNEAKEMEKEQIIDAYYYDPNCDEIKDDGEHYYNETFKSE